LFETIIYFFVEPISEPIAPFTLGVASLAVPQLAGTGFNIAFNQVPCS